MSLNSFKGQIESVRPAKDRPSPWSVPKVLDSLEPDGMGGEVETTTVFLTGAECPFRCTMCDLWAYTSSERTPVGAIPFQLSQVLSVVDSGKRRWLKLYNASNFFDPRSIPHEDLAEIAGQCSQFERVIVENHPRFCDDRMRAFAEQLGGQLEVAMGLETIHPKAMAAMNKGMTLDDFHKAVEKCHELGLDVRAFVLLHPPGIALEESVEWTWKTVAYALERNVRHVSVIPVRAGNGWIDKLIAEGQYQRPTVSLVKAFYDARHEQDIPIPSLSIEIPASLIPIPASSVVEFDLWDWDNLKGGCGLCRPKLKAHIEQCNRTQHLIPMNEIKLDCECTL